MNWDKGHQIYTKIKTLRKQYDRLGQLASQIADDRKSIEVGIVHSEYQPPRQNYSFFAMMDIGEEDYEAKVEIEPIQLELSDEQALAYIGQQMSFIEQLISKLEQKLKSL